MKIPLNIKNNYFSAPIAGFSDLPYRMLVREFGCGLCWSELIMARGVVENNQKTMDLLHVSEKDHPIVVQLGGNNPSIMGNAAKIAVDNGADAIDINCGCPVPKMVKRNYGAALMKEPELVGRIVEQVRKSVDVPIFVKIRAGFGIGDFTAVKVAKSAQSAGACAITVHGRYRNEFFKGVSDWNVITLVKEAIDIPVIGNGDISGYEDVEKMIQQTSCDAVMIGRATFGHPWIFQEIISTKAIPISPEKWLDTLNRHVKLLSDFYGETRCCFKLRTIFYYYTKGIKNIRTLRPKITQLKTISEFEKVRDEIFSLMTDSP